MSLQQWFRGLFRQEQRAGNYVDLVPYFGAPTYAGPKVSVESSLQYAAVYACTRIIAEDIAALPLVLYRRDGRNRVPAVEHPLYRILHDLPNPEITSFELREMMWAQTLLWGTGFCELQTDGSGRILALHPLLTSRMEGYRTIDGALFWFYRDPDNQVRLLDDQYVFRTKAFGFAGLMGLSVIKAVLMQPIGLGLAAEEYGARFFGNGARPGGVLKHPGKLSREAHARLQASFTGEHQGLSNAHRLKILEEGMDYQAMGIPPEEAQFLETRKFQVTEIARAFRVPPHMLADLDRATFSNIEHQSIDYVTHTLTPWLVRGEQAIQRDLLSGSERGRYFVKHNVAALLRGDTPSRYQAHAQGINTGFLTRNEARELEDLNPLVGLDAPLTPLNMIEAGAESPRAAEPPAQRRNTPSEQRDVSGQRHRTIQRHLRLFEEAIGRIVKREVADIRRAADSRLGKRSIAAFEEWLGNFYQQAREWMPDYLRALLFTYAETIFASVADELGGDVEPDGDELRAWIEEYLRNWIDVYAVGGEKQLRALLAESENEEAAAAAIHERLDGWEENRAQKTAFDQAFEAGNALAIFGYTVAGVRFLVWSGGDCPLCKRLNGRRIPIGRTFADEGDTIEGEGVSPFPVVRKLRHGPLHQGCDCVVLGG